MSRPQIEYYASTVSPWTYLGAARFRQIAEAHDAEVSLKIVDLGQVFPHTGGLPLPKRAPARQAYRMTELERFRDFHQLPLVLQPRHFPSRTPLSAHLCMLAGEQGGSKAGMLACEAVLTALWAEEKDMDDAGQLAMVLDKAGFDGPALLATADAEAARLAQQLADNSAKAVRKQVFGAPSYVLDDEVFWGQDRLDLLAWRLQQA